MDKSITITLIDNPVESIKLVTSIIMSQWTSAIIEEGFPKETEFSSKEEYELALKEYMLKLVEEVKESKHEIFTSILECYNQILSKKGEVAEVFKEQEIQSQLTIERANYDMKSAGIVTIGLGLLVPNFLPIAVAINVPRVLGDIFLKKFHLQRMQNNREVSKGISSIQEPLYWFTDQLRTDYHESNKKLEELKRRALKGENVIDELLEIMNPERLHLKKMNVPHELLVNEAELQNIIEKSK